MSVPYPSASLYVGDLASDVREENLFQVFNAVGAVASIRVCKDGLTKRSLGYAYVNFHSPQDATEAMEQLNNTPINGKICRIMWSQRDPSLRKSGVGNIFIKNLDKTIDHKALHDTFSDFGNIISCKVVTDEEGNSKGYGFVHYETQEMADRAIQAVNKMALKGVQVYVGRFVPRRERLKNREQQGFTNLYVKNFDESLDPEGLKALFSPYGAVQSVVIKYDESGKSKGFGFVNLQNQDDAKRALEELHGKVVGGKALYVSRAQKKAERQAELRQKFRSDLANKYQGVNLYVKNLSDDVDDSKLRTEFSAFGNITSAEVMKDDKNNSKGFGFVCFTTPEEASKAVTEMNGRLVGQKPIYVALAQRKEARRAQLSAQHAQRMKAGGPYAPSSMNGHLYANHGTPVFFPTGPQGVPGNPIPQGYGYPLPPPIQQQQPRARGWPQQHQFPPMQNYLVPVRQPRHNQNRQGGGIPNNRRGYNRTSRDQTPVGAPVTVPPTGIHPAMIPQVPIVTQPAVPAPHPEQADSLTLSMLEQQPSELHQVLIGERLFPLIAKTQPNRAGKITGMLLDRLNYPGGPEELVHLLENPIALNDKVNEALEVLAAHPDNETDGSEQV